MITDNPLKVTTVQQTAAKIRTGIEGLDQVLGGGLIEGTCALIEGAPGCGKTTLGLQFAYLGATQYDEPALVVTFEEFPDQLYRDALSLGWDLRTIEQTGKLRVMCMSPDAFQEELSHPEGFFEMRRAEMGLKRVVIDSATHFQQITSDPVELRKIIYGVRNGLARLGVTSMLTKEIETRTGEVIPFEEYVVDAVIRLTYERADNGGARSRFLEVLKSRGQPHASGRHAMILQTGGITVYPRVLQPARRVETKVDLEQRLSTGVSGLDEMLTGGVIPGYIVLVAGSTGTGKTTLGLQFLCDGVARGEKAMLVSFEERPEKIARLAAGYGFDLDAMAEKGLLRIVHRMPAGLLADQFLHELNAELRGFQPARVVLDSLTDLGFAVRDPGRLQDATWTLANMIESAGATALMTNEIPDVMGQFTISDVHLSIIADGIVLLRYVEIESEMQRAISVLKMRGVDHDKNIRRFTVTDRGLEIGPLFEGHEGIMGGTPQHRDIVMSLFSIDEEDQKINDELTKRFTKINPRVKVQPLTLSFNPDEARDMVMNVLRSKTTDMGVVPVDVYWIEEMARSRMLLRLDHFFPPADREAFLDIAIRQCRHEGHIYGVPSFITAGVLFYRADLLKKYGFKPPTTWDELIAQSRTILDGEKNPELQGFIFQGYEYEGMSCAFLEFLWSNGGDVVDGDGNVVIDSPEAIGALTYMRDFIHKHKITPEKITRAEFVEDYDDFVEGNAVFLRLWPHVMQAVESEGSRVAGKVKIAPLPAGPMGKHGVSVIGGWNLSIPTHTKSPAAAWSFIRFSTSYESQKQKAIKGGPLPTLKSLYDDPDVRRSKPYYAGLPEILSSARLRQDIPSYPQISKRIQRRVGAVLRGEMEPEEAAGLLAGDVRGILGKAEG